MTIPSVSASRSVRGGRPDQASVIVEGVLSKLELGSEKKQKHTNEIHLAVKECVIPHLSHFSKKGIDLISTGNVPAVPLFMIMASYLGGEKKEARLPEFIADLFDTKEIKDIKHDRELVQGGEASSFTLKDGVGRSLGSFYEWSKLSGHSSKEQISAVFLRPDLRPVKSDRETTSF